jgi:hypothetical protein
MIHGKRLAVPTICALLALSPSVQAGEPVRFAAVEAAGGASVAHARDNSTITTNPGAIVMISRYDAQLLGSFQAPGAFGVGAGIVDSKTSGVALGMSWRYTTDDPEPTIDELPGWVTTGTELTNRVRAHELGAALAGKNGAGDLSYGVGFSASFLNSQLIGHTFELDADVGVLGQLNEEWTLGFTGRDLMPWFGEDPAQLVAGTRFDGETASAALDVGVQLEDGAGLPLHTRIGGTLHIETVDLSAGYHLDGPARGHNISWGGGYTKGAATLNYTMLIPVHEKLGLTDLVSILGLRLET